MRFRDWRKQCLALCIGIFAGLLMMEVGLRVVRHFFPNAFFVDSGCLPEERHLWRGIDGFHLNNFGFKDVDFSIKKNHEVRIVALGDSFAYGAVPYEYNFLTLLEQGLRADKLDAEVLNMGIPRIGPEEYLQVLRHEALIFHPDAVLVCFFMGNDFTEYHPPRSHQWFERFYVYWFAKYFYGIFTSVNRLHATFYSYDDNAPTFTEKAFLEIERQRSFLFRKEGDVLREHFQGVRSTINEMASICRKNGVALAFVLIPDQIQVDTNLQQQLLVKFPGDFPAGQMLWNAPNLILSQYLSERKIPYLDLLDVFKTNGVDFYIPRNTHWNIAGNDLAAGKIRIAIRSLFPTIKKDSPAMGAKDLWNMP